MSRACVDKPDKLGWQFVDDTLSLLIQKMPNDKHVLFQNLPVSELQQHRATKPILGKTRSFIHQTLETFERKHPFGHMLSASMLPNLFVQPDTVLGQGAYGTTFSALLQNHRVIVKIAWDDANAIQGFNKTQLLSMTTKEGIKAFDTSALREAIISKLIANIAKYHVLPWFSPYFTFSYIPLSFDQVFLETKSGSRSFCPWKTDDRQSYPSVFKSLESDVSLFLPHAPKPLELVATMSISEQAQQTLSDFLHKPSFNWTLETVQELVSQCACAILSLQTTLAMEHGDMHLSNLMINENAHRTRTWARLADRSIVPVSIQLPYLVRIIDFGFARSDHVFGSGDIRTCLSIESNKRVHFGHGFLWPAELFDMACVLYEIKDRVRSKQVSESRRIRAWLQQACEKLQQECLDLMDWTSMEDGMSQIAASGLYPLTFSQITGGPLTHWLSTIMNIDSRHLQSDDCIIELPKDKVNMVQVGKGTPLTGALRTFSTNQYARIETDAPDVHGSIMRKLATDVISHVEWKPVDNANVLLTLLETRALLDFYSVQMYSYYEKRAMTIAQLIYGWNLIRESNDIRKAVQRFVSLQDLRHLTNLSKFIRVMEQRRNASLSKDMTEEEAAFHHSSHDSYHEDSSDEEWPNEDLE